MSEAQDRARILLATLAIGLLLANDPNGGSLRRQELFNTTDKSLLKEAKSKHWQTALLDALFEKHYIDDAEGGGYVVEDRAQLVRLLVEVQPLMTKIWPPWIVAFTGEEYVASAPTLPTLQQLLWPNDPAVGRAQEVPESLGDDDASPPVVLPSVANVSLPKSALRRTGALDDEELPSEAVGVLEQMLSLTLDQSSIFKKLVDGIFDVRTKVTNLEERLVPHDTVLSTIKKRLDEIGKQVAEQSAGAVGQKLQATLAQVILELGALRVPVQALAAQTSAVDVDARLTVLEAEVRALRESNEALALALRANEQNQMPKLLRRLESFSDEIKSLSELALEAMPHANNSGG